MKKNFNDLTDEEKRELANKYAWDEVEGYDLEALTEIAHDKIEDDLLNDENYLKDMYENDEDDEE